MSSVYASSVAMVRPAAFQFNSGTAASNHFQAISELDLDVVQNEALAQFDAMVHQLQQHHISVLVLQDSATPPLADAVFPNNWFISLPCEIILCPMQAISRRLERKPEHLDKIGRFTSATNFTDWSQLENDDMFLEGTGSLVIDHINRLVFACHSERTTASLFQKFCDHTGYNGFLFNAVDRLGRPIYHTNVMMCLGNGYAILCEESVSNSEERKQLRNLLTFTGRSILPIGFNEMENFAGNMLQLRNNIGEHLLVMSTSAHKVLSREQIQDLECAARILPIDVGVIERSGGGSVRCMMAELFPV